eukprot:2661359-Rhodomonas_salina.4
MLPRLVFRLTLRARSLYQRSSHSLLGTRSAASPPDVVAVCCGRSRLDVLQIDTRDACTASNTCSFEHAQIPPPVLSATRVQLGSWRRWPGPRALLAPKRDVSTCTIGCQHACKNCYACCARKCKKWYACYSNATTCFGLARLRKHNVAEHLDRHQPQKHADAHGLRLAGAQRTLLRRAQRASASASRRPPRAACPPGSSTHDAARLPRQKRSQETQQRDTIPTFEAKTQRKKTSKRATRN